MARFYAILLVTSLSFAQQVQVRPPAAEPTVKLDYKGFFLSKTVNSYGEAKPIILPSSTCEISTQQVLRINASIKVHEGKFGDLEVTQRTSPVNAQSHGREVLFRAFDLGLRSISINWEETYKQMREAAKIEPDSDVMVEPEVMRKRPTVEYKIVILGEYQPAGTEKKADGSTVKLERPTPTVVTLYSVKDKVVARKGDVVTELIQKIDEICDNEPGYEKLKYPE